MTILDALLAWQNGAYRNMKQDELLVLVDTLNRRIDGLESLIRSGATEVAIELRGDLRTYQQAKDAVVGQLNRVINNDDLKTF